MRVSKPRRMPCSKVRGGTQLSPWMSEAAVAVKGALVGAATRPAQPQLCLAVNRVPLLCPPAGQECGCKAWRGRQADRQGAAPASAAGQSIARPEALAGVSCNCAVRAGAEACWHENVALLNPVPACTGQPVMKARCVHEKTAGGRQAAAESLTCVRRQPPSRKCRLWCP